MLCFQFTVVGWCTALTPSRTDWPDLRWESNSSFSVYRVGGFGSLLRIAQLYWTSMPHSIGCNPADVIVVGQYRAMAYSIDGNLGILSSLESATYRAVWILRGSSPTSGTIPTSRNGIHAILP